MTTLNKTVKYSHHPLRLYLLHGFSVFFFSSWLFINFWSLWIWQCCQVLRVDDLRNSTLNVSERIFPKKIYFWARIMLFNRDTVNFINKTQENPWKIENPSVTISSVFLFYTNFILQHLPKILHAWEINQQICILLWNIWFSLSILLNIILIWF